ncbi:MAG: YIP1 family protein [Acidobacteriota bacterium]|nr:YIP1 family protein [Acidobacteriota bacterium]
MATDASPALDRGPAKMSEGSRLLGVFFEPGKTFADIAERPSWLVPLLIGILSAVLLIYLFNRHVGWESILQRAMDNNRFVQQLPPEQRQIAFDRQLRLIPVFSYLGAILGFPITLLLAAGLATGIIRGLLGTPIRFVQAFAAMAYAFLPRVIYAGLSISVMFLKNPDEFDLQNAFASNPGAFMDPQKSSRFLYTVASQLDVFSIWVILLVAVGLKAAGGKRLSFGGALFAVVLPWAVYVLVRGGLAAAGLGG